MACQAHASCTTYSRLPNNTCLLAAAPGPGAATQGASYVYQGRDATCLLLCVLMWSLLCVCVHVTSVLCAHVIMFCVRVHVTFVLCDHVLCPWPCDFRSVWSCSMSVSMWLSFWVIMFCARVHVTSVLCDHILCDLLITSYVKLWEEILLIQQDMWTFIFFVIM